MGAEEWSLGVSHLHGRAGGLNYYHMEPKGRKRMLLRQPESYGLPDLLAHKINKGTATACKYARVCILLCFTLQFMITGEYLTLPAHLKTTMHFLVECI